MAHAARIAEARHRREAVALAERARRVRRALCTVPPTRRFAQLDDEAVRAIAAALGMTEHAARELLFDVMPDLPSHPPARRRHPR